MDSSSILTFNIFSQYSYQKNNIILLKYIDPFYKYNISPEKFTGFDYSLQFDQIINFRTTDILDDTIGQKTFPLLINNIIEFKPKFPIKGITLLSYRSNKSEKDAFLLFALIGSNPHSLGLNSKKHTQNTTN